MNRLLVLLLPWAVVAGCASVGELPAHWDGTVRRKTQHFRLETDIAPSEVEPLLDEAERIYAEYLDRFWVTDREDLEPIRLLVFRDQYDYARFLGLRVPSREELAAERREIEASGYRVLGLALDTPRGHFNPAPAEGPIIGLPQAEGLLSVLRHELVHYFVRLQDPSPPAWLDEGVAEYLRLIRSRDQPARILRRLRRAQLAGEALTLRELARMNHHDFRKREEVAYPTAWLLVRHLLEEEGALSLGRLRERKKAERRLRELTVEVLLRTAEERARSYRGEWVFLSSRAIRTRRPRPQRQYPAAWPSLRDSEAP